VPDGGVELDEWRDVEGAVVQRYYRALQGG
jgi:hypothetical protein